MKKKNLLMMVVAISGLATISMAQTTPNYVPTNGLVGWWPFNGNANDESGNGNNGSTTGTFSNDRNNSPNSAIALSGSSQLISITGGNSFDADTFSLSFWTLANSYNIHNKIQYGVIGSSLRFSMNWSVSGVSYSPMTCAGGYATSGNGTSILGINPSTWYHITYVVQGLTTSFYINGSLIDVQSTASPLTCFNSSMNLYFGGDIGGGIIEYYSGLFDDIGFWNRALSPCEVQALYSGQITSPSSGIDVVSTCTSYQWIDGNTYTQSTNTPTFILTNSQGCDSTVTLDLTISQPAQPTTACYETATFNATTCQWDVTGTQPTQPTTACYETATFNTTSCQWDVTGTQPTQPTTACYETATFNTTTCQWNVTGTQPTQPTTACYETATFNTTTCQWDVTGTQPTQPTTACYETATFNTTTCQWDVTGTQPIISQPTNQTININNNTQFVVSSSDPSATFQWQTDLGVGFQNLNSVGQYSGTTNDTLTVSNVTMSNNNQPFRCIISSGSCSDTSNVAVLTVNNNVGINEFSQDNLFSVFPNPAQSLINVKVESKIIGTVYAIYDNTGRAILTGKINSENTTILLENLSSGIYMFSVGENMKQTFKIIKE